MLSRASREWHRETAAKRWKNYETVKTEKSGVDVSFLRLAVTYFTSDVENRWRDVMSGRWCFMPWSCFGGVSSIRNFGRGGSEPSVDHTAYQLMGGSDRIGGRIDLCCQSLNIGFTFLFCSVNEMVTGSTGAWGYIDGGFSSLCPLFRNYPWLFCSNLFSLLSETYNSLYVFLVRGIIKSGSECGVLGLLFCADKLRMLGNNV